MKQQLPEKGIYLITNEEPFYLLRQKLELALQMSKICMLQYRRKKIKEEDQLFEVEKIKALCARFNKPLIINDNLDLAKKFEAGLHLGQEDGSLTQARKILGKQAIIGRTCHNQLLLAQQAVEEGANYVAFGAVFPTASKIVKSNIQIEQLENFNTQIKQQFPAIKTCAIGGITASNANLIKSTGVDYQAVIGGILNLPPEQIQQAINSWG